MTTTSVSVSSYSFLYLLSPYETSPNQFKIQKYFLSNNTSKLVWTHIILISQINSLHKNEKSHDGKDQMRITSETSSTYITCNLSKILHCSTLHSLIMPSSKTNTELVLLKLRFKWNLLCFNRLLNISAVPCIPKSLKL